MKGLQTTVMLGLINYYSPKLLRVFMDANDPIIVALPFDLHKTQWKENDNFRVWVRIWTWRKWGAIATHRLSRVGNLHPRVGKCAVEHAHNTGRVDSKWRSFRRESDPGESRLVRERKLLVVQHRSVPSADVDELDAQTLVARQSCEKNTNNCSWF